MFKKFTIAFYAFTIIIQINSITSWKPIAAPSTASFSIRQSHPALGNSISTGGQSSIEHTNLAFIDDQNLADGHTLISGQSSTGGGGDIGDNDYKGFEFEDGRVFSSGTGFAEDACSVDKYAFDSEGTIHYRNKIPKMDQFTICYWMRFTNHSGDHTLLTYSVDDEPREIQMWIANSKGSSYISMAVRGQQIYRLNYPLKMRKWHHSCSSWNGKTGEWQLWIKSERVGRGFHNRLVGRHIPSKGLLFSGGPSITGPTSSGLHFEMTLLQIYKVALTAGKAHRDHKHHHVHHFDHNGPASSTPAPTRQPQANGMQVNSLLANGQIPTQVRINLAGQQQTGQQQPAVKGVPSQILGGMFGDPRQNQQSQQQQPQIQATINTNFINGQFHTGSRLVAQQLAPGVSGIIYPQQLDVFNRPRTVTPDPLGVSPITFPSQSAGQSNQFVSNPANIQFIDNQQRYLFKRTSDNSDLKKTVTKNAKKIEKRETSKLNKRDLVMLGDGSLVDDSLIGSGYNFEGLAQFGLPAFKQGLQSKMNIEDEIKEHDHEPAEEEVKAVLNLCTSCDYEPFKGAIVLAWKDAITSQDGTLKGRSVGGCGYF